MLKIHQFYTYFNLHIVDFTLYIHLIKNKLEGDVLMITSGNNASKNECPTVGTDESQ